MNMKCLCGFEETDDTVEEVEVLFQRGPRKGQVKTTYKDYQLDAKRMDTFTIMSNDGEKYVKACPTCGRLYLDGYY